MLVWGTKGRWFESSHPDKRLFAVQTAFFVYSKNTSPPTTPKVPHKIYCDITLSKELLTKSIFLPETFELFRIVLQQLRLRLYIEIGTHE